MKNEFQTFLKVYEELIFESLKHNIKSNPIPNISKENLIYKPKVKNEIIKALNNINWFYDNEDIKFLYTENIILESPGSIEYPGSLCDQILNSKNNQTFTNNQICSFINEDWKYYKKLLKFGKSIKILKFDFGDVNEIQEIFKNDEDILNIALEIFLNNKNANGASLYYNDLCTLIFNIKKYTKKTILHEFTHYIQNLLNVETVKVKKNLDKNKLSFLNLSNDDLSVVIEILKDKNEIIPYVNEFCEDIMNVFKEYQKINEGLEWSNTFIEYFLKMILNSQNLKDEKLFKLYKHITNNDLLPLYIVIGCNIFDIQWKRIEHILYVKNKEIKF